MTKRKPPKTAVEMLERTADYIETHAWGTGGVNDYEQLGTPGSCPCLLESLAIVAGRHPGDYGTQRRRVWKHGVMIGYELRQPLAEYEAIRALEEVALADYGTNDPTDVNDRVAHGDKRKIVRYVRRTARRLAAGQLTAVEKIPVVAA